MIALFQQKWIGPTSDKSTYAIWFGFVWAVESTEKKGNVRLVNNLLLCCLPASQRLSSKYHAHWWLHYLKHSPSFECAMCRSHNVFRYVLRKLSLLSCALLRRIFSWSSRHWLLTWQNDLKNILAMNIVIKFVNIYIYLLSVIHL